jgi:glycosyltransferase involved in cell wall biosynthesis
METRVSVIVPVFNGGEVLKTCLRTVLACSPPADEVVVVCDGSTDGSAAAAEEVGARVVRLSENAGPARARNAGVAASSGDLLLFVDADVSVPPDAVARVRELFASPGAPDAVFGCYDDAPTDPGFFSQYRNLLHHHVHLNSDEEASTFWSGLGAVRREAFLGVGGFDASRRHVEDVDLGYRLKEAGRRIRLEKSLRGKHHKRWTLGSTIRTDVLHRAGPWTALLWDAGRLPRDLNFRTSHRVSGVLAVLLPLLAVGCPFLPTPWREIVAGAALATVAALLLLNRDLYGFLRRRRGLFFAARSVLAHGLYYVCGSVTLGVCWTWFTLSRRPRGRRPSTSTPPAEAPTGRPLPRTEA